MSCRQAQAISRRAFFGGGAASLALWSLMPRSAIAGTRDPRLLVVVLRGGLDGLAAVAPIGDPDYARLRAAIALPATGEDAGLRARRVLCPQRGHAGAARALPETRSADRPRGALALSRPLALRRPGRARERSRRRGPHRGRLAQSRAPRNCRPPARPTPRDL